MNNLVVIKTGKSFKNGNILTEDPTNGEQFVVERVVEPGLYICMSVGHDFDREAFEEILLRFNSGHVEMLKVGQLLTADEAFENS
jgi:hypothetical protein